MTTNNYLVNECNVPGHTVQYGFQDTGNTICQLYYGAIKTCTFYCQPVSFLVDLNNDFIVAVWRFKKRK